MYIYINVCECCRAAMPWPACCSCLVEAACDAVCMYVCMYVCLYVCVCMHACMPEDIMYVCTCIFSPYEWWLHGGNYAYMFVPLHVCTYIDALTALKPLVMLTVWSRQSNRRVLESTPCYDVLTLMHLQHWSLLWCLPFGSRQSNRRVLESRPWLQCS